MTARDESRSAPGSRVFGNHLRWVVATIREWRRYRAYDRRMTCSSCGQYGDGCRCSEVAYLKQRIAEAWDANRAGREGEREMQGDLAVALRALREIEAHEGYLPNRWSLVARKALRTLDHSASSPGSRDECF